MNPTLTLLALATSALAFDDAAVDSWAYEGDAIQYLDESYEGGFDIDKVVGGKQVSNNRWDATVGVIMGGYVGCTGTLVHPKVAITAAHCVGGISGILIDADDWTEADNDQVVAVTDEIIHPDYRNSMWGGNDIAVLLLADRVTKVPSAEIALECVLDDYLENGSKVHIVGYGATTESGNGFNSKLNEGGTLVQTKDCSVEQVDGIWTGCDPDLDGGEIGAGGNGVDACFGDSGGPLYLKAPVGDFLVGVTSRAYAGVPGNAPCAYGGIYTRPDYYAKWIEDVSGVKLRYNYCNEPPNATAEGILTKPGKTGYTALVVSDPDGDVALATYEVVEPPEHGTVVIEADGVIGYTANDDGYLGPDSFTVAISDSGNDSYKRTGDPISIELSIPVEIDKGLFVSPSKVGGGCGCTSTGSGTVGWLGLLGALVMVRRRRG